jgi:predicted ATPase
VVESIEIKNFKSVVDLKLELGSFNVLVGENGCGKSNILEGIAFGAAAAANKLDYEFLGSRGIRVTNPEFILSAFPHKNKKNSKSFLITVENKHTIKIADIFIDPENPKKWIDRVKLDSDIAMAKALKAFIDSGVFKKMLGGKPKTGKWEEASSSTDESRFQDYKEVNTVGPEISNYIIYSPEQTSLRKFEETNQIYPLGIKGEGLFQYLKELASSPKTAKTIKEIEESLSLLDWYDGFELPNGAMSNEFYLRIKDKYLAPELQYFDQRSANEGFLFLLFYLTLFIAKGTPTFFAIDNIDTALNPKLCAKLTRTLAELAKKHKKQVIVTTQNPAILDGLNLKDDSQRLFVVRRSDEGHTKAKRVDYNPKREMKLSEIWTNGFIGGLPENF